MRCVASCDSLSDWKVAEVVANWRSLAKPPLQHRFSSCRLELPPVTLTYEPDLDRVKLNHRADIYGKCHFCSTHRHTQRTERTIRTTKVVDRHKMS